MKTQLVVLLILLAACASVPSPPATPTFHLRAGNNYGQFDSIARTAAAEQMELDIDSAIDDMIMMQEATYDALCAADPECSKASGIAPLPAQASQCPYGCTQQLPGCNIKGNISISSGEKIYHVPGQEYYLQTVISPEYGERWFCTEAEAIANGWRRAKQ